MQTEIKKQDNSTVSLKGNLTSEELDKYIKVATIHFVNEAELPGFRKGKAPEQLVVSQIGEGRILEEAAHHALTEAYIAAIRDNNLEPLGKPEIRITKLARGNPLEWEADVAVMPEIALPDYKIIAHEKNSASRPEPVVEDEEVTKAVEWLQKSRRKEEDGKESLPELNDEFAKSLGGFETLDALKNHLKTTLLEEKKDKEIQKKRMGIVEDVATKSKMTIPTLLLEAEKDKMINELRANTEQIGISWDDYLKHIKKTEEEIRASWVDDAKKRVELALILREIAKKEKIEPTDDELDTWTRGYIQAQPEETRPLLDPERVKDYAYGILRNNKVFNFLEQC